MSKAILKFRAPNVSGDPNDVHFMGHIPVLYHHWIEEEDRYRALDAIIKRSGTSAVLRTFQASGEHIALGVLTVIHNPRIATEYSMRDIRVTEAGEQSGDEGLVLAFTLEYFQIESRTFQP